jgi:hypothetical protein
MFVIADYFAVSDISVRWYVSDFDLKKCVVTRDVSNSLEEVSAFVVKAAFPKGLEMGILHE